MLHRQGYTGGGRGTSTGGSGMLLLHGQEYIRKMQQDVPQAGICPEETAGDTIGNTQVGTYPEEAAGCSTGGDIPQEAAGQILTI